MPDDPSCQAPQAPTGAVPRTCVPFAHVPAVPVVAVPYVPVPVPSGLPVLSVSGVFPDRTGNVDVSQFLSSWAGEFAAAKADKAPPSAAGNLASLDASGNLADSGATPASIKAAAVAEVVANAPGTMDTLKEIADILGSSQQSGTVLKRILDLESGKASKAEMSVAPVAGSPDKTTIQLKTGMDATVLTAHQDISGKRGLTDMAVYENGFTDWEFSDGETRAVVVGQCPSESPYPEDIWGKWALYGEDCDTLPRYQFDTKDEAESALSFVYGVGGNDVTATRSRAVVPTQDTLARASQVPAKTSQLTNDSGFLTSHQDISGKADKVAGAAAGNLASLTAQGNLVDSGVKPSDFAAKADLPYRLVEPGKWEYVPLVQLTSFAVTSSPEYDSGFWTASYYSVEYGTETLQGEGDADALSIDFAAFLATRPSLPGHLCARAVNAVSVSAATTLTLPAPVNADKSRDLLVRLTVSADSVVTFSAPSGETVTWDDAGSPTATYEAGTHLLRFTEVGLDNGSHIFHFTDLGAGGSIDPAVLNGKLEATSAAPAFDATKTYSVGEYVTYEGVLYECSTAVTTAGTWTGSTNWTATNMTSPDATLDLMADGHLRLVSEDGEVLWMQGYGLAPSSSVSLSCDKVNFYAFASGTVTQAFDMPSAPSGKVGDFVLDVDNTANASASATATLTGAGTAFDVFTPEGVNLSTDILTFAGGEQCELYFTMTAFGTAAKPAWKVVKQVVEKQEFGS